MSGFSGEQLTVSAGRLFCRPCRETLSLKRSSIQNHVKSNKHSESKKRMESMVARQRDIAAALMLECILRGKLCVMINEGLGWKY